jgi:hypothetical protein
MFVYPSDGCLFERSPTREPRDCRGARVRPADSSVHLDRSAASRLLTVARNTVGVRVAVAAVLAGALVTAASSSAGQAPQPRAISFSLLPEVETGIGLVRPVAGTIEPNPV